MSTTHSRYIRVILPIKLEWLPTYSVQEPLDLGTRVRVRLAGREYVGVVYDTDVTPDIELKRITPVVAVESGLPAVSRTELKFWEFISGYYMCTLGEVYKAAYPYSKTGSEIQSEKNLETLRGRLEKKLTALQTAREGTKRRAGLLEDVEKIREEIEAARKEPAGGARGARKAGKPAVLTGPSRTEAYVEAVLKTLDEGGTALILTPELAFCANLEREMKPSLPQLMTFNSSLTPVRRRRVSDSVRSGSPTVILGTRSAIFLPFSRLDLVIIDEEQDTSYKQTEPAPRYNGRDAAIALAALHGADVLLGSCFPSLETSFNCGTGKYEARTCGDNAKRDAVVIDVPAERRKNGMLGEFSRKLVDEIRSADGTVVLIRGWEKRQELADKAQELFPGKDIRIMTLAEFKHSDALDAALTAVMQADALLSKDDFRSDERALQLLAVLGRFSRRTVIQTSVPDRFDPSRDAATLLEERIRFGFPPYTRIVDIRKAGGTEIVSRHFLPRDRSLADRKAEISASLPPGTYPDVDPI